MGPSQDYFVFIVSQFLYIPWNHARKQAAIRSSLQDGNLCTPSITVAAAETFEFHLTEYLKGQVKMTTQVDQGLMLYEFSLYYYYYYYYNYFIFLKFLHRFHIT